MNKVLVTGANGLVGKKLCSTLSDRGHFVRGTFRSPERFFQEQSKIECISVGEIGPSTDWTDALHDIDAIVHLAARVHVMKDESGSPLDEYRKINTEGTKRLALMAGLAGVKRMIYVSTVKAIGDFTLEQPFNEDDTPKPVDPYSISKWEAELALKCVAFEQGLQVTIIRPPIVYGPGVKANFYKMLEAVRSGIPLPLSRICNRRSMIYIGNIVDVIITCIIHPKAANQTYLVSDGYDVSTPELIRRVAAAMSVKPHLFSFPPSFMHLVGNVIGKGPAVERLLGSLSVDISKIRSELGWKPPFTMEQGLRETVEWFLKDSAKI